MPRHRLSVALLVPPPVAAEVDGLRRALGDTALGRVPAHLTLVPPVNVRATDLDAALTDLRRAASTTGPITLDVGPVTTFHPVTPTLYLAVGGPDLAKVQALRDAVFRPPLTRPLTHPFVPHVTVSADASPERITAAVAALGSFVVEVTFDRVTLLEERRRPDGVRVWEAMADTSLGPPAVVGRGGLELEITESSVLDPHAVGWLDATWTEYDLATYGTRWRPDEPLALVARRNDDVVGVATGHVRGGEAYLARLIAAPTCRGEGVGGHLLARFMAQAAEQGADRVTVRALADGPATCFYRARGFEEVGRLPAWRFGRDFVRLVRAL